MSSYRFGFFTNHPYDDLLDMVTHKNQQYMSDPAVFQNSCSMYTISYIYISFLADVKTVAVDFQQLQ